MKMSFYYCVLHIILAISHQYTKGINRNDMVWKRLMSDFPQMNELLYKEWKREAHQENS